MRVWRGISYRNRVLLITAAGAALRGAFIAVQPLWRDEAFTAVVVQRPLQSMLDAVGADSAPPLAYVLTHSVVSVAGASPPALRLVSLLAGIACIPLAAALGRRGAGDNGGTWAAIVTAVAPAMVIASRDARMYAPAMMLVLGAVLTQWRYLEDPRPRRWCLHVMVVMAALQTEYFAALPIAALVVAVCVYRPPFRIVALSALAPAIAAASLIPWLALRASQQLHHAGGGFWVEPISAKTIGGTVVQFFSGPPIDPGVPGKLLLQGFQGMAIAALCVAFLTLVVRRRHISADTHYAVRYLGIVGVGVPVMLALVSLWHPLLEARYASVAFPPLFVVAGIGLASLPLAAVRRGAAVAVLAATTVLSAGITHPDTPAALAVLNGHPGHVIAAPSEYLLVLYYGDAPLLGRTHVGGNDIAWFWGTAAYPPDAGAPDPRDGAPIISVDQPGDPPVTGIPDGYRSTGLECVTGTCITFFVHE